MLHRRAGPSVYAAGEPAGWLGASYAEFFAGCPRSGQRSLGLAQPPGALLGSCRAGSRVFFAQFFMGCPRSGQRGAGLPQPRGVGSAHRVVPRMNQPLNAPYEPCEAGVRTSHSFVSPALRSTAASARNVGAGIGFSHAASVGLLRHQPVGKAWCGSARWAVASGHQPNPSIEGTSNSKLRLLSAAPHLKR